jgi:uncharacterized protein YcfJ
VSAPRGGQPAVGAVGGGAVAKDVGDRDLTTAVGAAAGAFIGKKIQQRVQENRAEQRTVTTIERKCARSARGRGAHELTRLHANENDLQLTARPATF